MRAGLFLVSPYFTVKSFSNFKWNYWIFMWVLLWNTLTSNFFFCPHVHEAAKCFAKLFYFTVATGNLPKAQRKDTLNVRLTSLHIPSLQYPFFSRSGYL